MLNTLRTNLARFIIPHRNAMTLAREFLVNGNKIMRPDWTQVVMNDQDLYTGYSYAAIRNRSNNVARIATDYVRTESDKEGEVHPYLQTIEASPTFTDYQFWSTISTYLDLEGVYYLFALRNKKDTRIGNITEFKLLNPYNIRRVLKRDSLEVGGYIEVRKGMRREIPPEMIIEIRELNPFSDEIPFSMTDAAKESQFTIKTAGDYTRHTLKHNINAPGILSTDVIIEDEDFRNFKARIKNNTKGEPLFSNGAGGITWDAMNIDLSKAALKDVNEMNREALFSVAGVSKTIMGIEQSGTTRETAKVQKDLLTEGQTIPRIQVIIDALNQDYRNHYPESFKKSKLNIIVDNPTATDHDADIKGTESKAKKAELYNDLLSKGYNKDLVSKYIKGEIDIDQLGEPDIKKIQKDQQEHLHDHEKKNITSNSLLIQQQTGSLQNSIQNIDARIVAECVNKIDKKMKNAFEDEKDILSSRDEKEFINDLELILAGFYGIVITLQGGQSMRDRRGELSLPGTFVFDATIKEYIKKTSKNVAQSHVQTIVNDVLKTAQEGALKGLSQRELANLIKKKYNDVISETRAKTIARTETNRAFTRAQYEADKQFIRQNKLQGRAFKQWKTRSAHPCPYCESLEAMGPIPFDDTFKDIGDDIEADGKTLKVSFEDIEAGSAHPNCSCIYELIIEEEK